MGALPAAFEGHYSPQSHHISILKSVLQGRYAKKKFHDLINLFPYFLSIMQFYWTSLKG